MRRSIPGHSVDAVISTPTAEASPKRMQSYNIFSDWQKEFSEKCKYLRFTDLGALDLPIHRITLWQHYFCSKMSLSEPMEERAVVAS